MSFFTRKSSLGKQGFESGAHKTMENQDLVDGVFEPPPSPSTSRADLTAQGGYRRSKDYSGTTNAAGTTGLGAGSIFGNSSSGSLMSKGGRHTDPSTSSGSIFSKTSGTSSKNSSNTGIFGSGKTTDSSSGSSGTSLLDARGSQHTAGSSTTGSAPTHSVFDKSSATVRDTGAGAADSVADTLRGVEGAVRRTGAPAANTLHDTDKGYGTVITCEILPRAENGVGIGSSDAGRYGAAGSAQSAGSSLGDTGAARIAKDVDSIIASGSSVTGGSNVKYSINDSAKASMRDTGSRILGREIGTGVLKPAGSGAASSSRRGSAPESTRDNSESGSAGSIFHDTGNYGASSVDSTDSGTSRASRLSDVGTARRGTGPVASTVAAGEPIDKRATIGRSSGDAGHAVGYDANEILSERYLRH